jgi:hypothetical protein
MIGKAVHLLVREAFKRVVFRVETGEEDIHRAIVDTGDLSQVQVWNLSQLEGCLLIGSSERRVVDRPFEVNIGVKLSLVLQGRTVVELGPDDGKGARKGK